MHLYNANTYNTPTHAQVHVRVEAEGPTRVLSFHDEGSDDDAEGVRHSVLDLGARLKQLENQLRVVNAQVCAMHGLPKGVLDLYGRHVLVPGSAVGRAEDGVQFSDTASAVSGSKSAVSGIPSIARSELVRWMYGGHTTCFTIIPNNNAPFTQRNTRLALLAGNTSLLQDLLAAPSSRGQKLRQELLASSTPSFIAREGSSHPHAHPGPSSTWPLHGNLSQGAAEFRNMGAAAQQAFIGVIISNQLQQHRRDNDALVLGGGLNVTVLEAVGLQGTTDGVCSFAKVGVTDPYQTLFNPMASSVVPVGKAERWPGLQARVLQEQQTPVLWQSNAPKWDCLLQFRDVCAASELVLDLYDVGTAAGKLMRQGGTTGMALVGAVQDLVNKSNMAWRFLGRIQVCFLLEGVHR